MGLGVKPGLAVSLAAMLDPMDMGLSGPVVHRVEDPPVPDAGTIPWGNDSLELAGPLGSWVLLQPE